jgi:GNAT superfamily N-acetyltransferase
MQGAHKKYSCSQPSLNLSKHLLNERWLIRICSAADEWQHTCVQIWLSQLQLADTFLGDRTIMNTELLPIKIATSLWLVPSSDPHLAFLQQLVDQNRMAKWMEKSATGHWLSELTSQQPHIQQQPHQAQPSDATEQFSYVISSKGHWVGRLLMSRSHAAIHILDITLLPDFQNQGLGQAVINYLQQQAQNLLLPLTLHADETSRAYEWCLDCGFITTFKTGVMRAMAWNLPELTEQEAATFAH